MSPENFLGFIFHLGRFLPRKSIMKRVTKLANYISMTGGTDNGIFVTSV